MYFKINSRKKVHQNIKLKVNMQQRWVAIKIVKQRETKTKRGGMDRRDRVR